MASVSTFSLSQLNPPSRHSSSPPSHSNPLKFHFPSIKFQTQFKKSAISCYSSSAKLNNQSFFRPRIVRAVAEGEEAAADVAAEETSAPPATADETVSVAVSSSDVLTMFFQAEGTMADSALPAVTQALEGVEGVSDLKVQLLEGIASVVLTKQTTVQATGVASNLVEIIQGSGFKLQTLNLSFKDEEDF